MESLHRLAAGLDEAAATLAAVEHRVAATDPAHPAFGAEAAGRPGEVGRALHARWCSATLSRAREAAGAAARIEELAAAVRAAADGYADTERNVRWRQPGEA